MLQRVQLKTLVFHLQVWNLTLSFAEEPVTVVCVYWEMMATLFAPQWTEDVRPLRADSSSSLVSLNSDQQTMLTEMQQTAYRIEVVGHLFGHQHIKESEEMKWQTQRRRE